MLPHSETLPETNAQPFRTFHSRQDILAELLRLYNDPEAPWSKKLDILVRIGQEEHGMFVDKKKFEFDFTKLARQLSSGDLKEIAAESET